MVAEIWAYGIVDQLVALTNNATTCCWVRNHFIHVAVSWMSIRVVCDKNVNLINIVTEVDFQLHRIL